jgi:hypothetical protein
MTLDHSVTNRAESSPNQRTRGIQLNKLNWPAPVSLD